MHNGEHRWELKFDLECSLRLLRNRAQLAEAWLDLASKGWSHCIYLPNVVEGEFCELRLYRILGSSSEVRPYGAWLCPDPGARLPSVLELLQAAFLGVVQGLSEFLPVSSSGHLLLSQYFLGMDQKRFGLSFDAAIHTGTVLGGVCFFGGALWAMAGAFLHSLPRPDFADAQVRLAYLILIATVPAALIGFLFEDFFATQVRSPWVVVFNLVFVGALFLVAESVGRKTESASKLGPLGAIGVGLGLLGCRGLPRHQVPPAPPGGPHPARLRLLPLRPGGGRRVGALVLRFLTAAGRAAYDVARDRGQRHLRGRAPNRRALLPPRNPRGCPPRRRAGVDRAAPAGRGGRRQGAPAPQDRALRRDALRGA